MLDLWNRPDDVDLWTIDLRGEREDLVRADEVLSAAERDRFRRVLGSVQRGRLILARAALKAILARYMELDPAQLAIKSGSGGKPVLEAEPGLSFNLSHSQATGLLAVTTRPAVGVDVEVLGRRVTTAVMRRALGPSEQTLVFGLPEGAREEAFLRHWTAKEAYSKALGDGLSVGMAAITIHDALGSPRLDHRLGVSDGRTRAGWTLQRFDPSAEVMGAVVVAGGAWRACRHVHVHSAR
jgi:4'-phosphopantetheinyl transferase